MLASMKYYLQRRFRNSIDQYINACACVEDGTAILLFGNHSHFGMITSESVLAPCKNLEKKYKWWLTCRAYYQWLVQPGRDLPVPDS